MTPTRRPVPDPHSLPRDLQPVARKAQAVRRLEARVAAMRLELYDAMRFAMSDGRGTYITGRAAGMSHQGAEAIKRKSD